MLYDHSVQDITPAGKKISTFDTFQATAEGDVTVAVATQSVDSKSNAPTDVYIATIDAEKPNANISEHPYSHLDIFNLTKICSLEYSSFKADPRQSDDTLSFLRGVHRWRRRCPRRI